MSEHAAPARPSGLSLGRPFGIPIYLAPSWIVISLFVAYGAAGDFGSRPGSVPGTSAGDLAVGAVVAVALAASVLAHELGHSAISLVLGIPIRRITLFVFGGYAEIDRESDHPADEYLIAVAGPLVSLLLGGLGVAAANLLPDGGALQFVAGYVGFTNTALAVLNLLPALPLDGGRVLRAIVWQRTGDRRRATGVGVVAGKVLAVALGAAGIFAVRAGSLGGLYTLLLAGFLWTSAAAARQPEQPPVPLELRRLTRPAVAVPVGLPLSEALRRARPGAWLVTVDGRGRPAGVLSAAAADAVPAERRPWLAVDEVCRSVEPGMVLPADLDGGGLLEAMRATPASEYLVVEADGAVAGVLSAGDVRRVAAGAQELGSAA